MAESFYRCECCVHALVVEKDEHGSWTFGVWEWSPYGGALRFRDRLRYIWQVIRHGKPWGEHVSLKKADATRLALKLLDAPEGVVWSAAGTTWSQFTPTQGRTA